ncbi:MAG: serine protease [Caulobacterales bacterium]
MKRAVIAFLLAFALPAHAVVILEQTWRANGGSHENPGSGFTAHDALGAQTQFRPMVAITEDDREWGIASGVWLGNANGHAYVLTAAHVVSGDKAEQLRVRSAGGTVRRGAEYHTHPGWRDDVSLQGGIDMAILVLDGPIDDAGTPPILYSGRREQGARAVIAGFGTHGVAPYGHGWRYGPEHGDAMTAAENVIDRVEPYRIGGEGGDWGNQLTIDLDQPNGNGKNRTGDVAPISPLEGILAPGDSGGSLWVNFRGAWRVVGINSSGDPGAAYQDVSNFARISTQRGWIRSVFPGVRFEGDKTE